ncbi:uncharacterized protein si:ch211-153b23.7 [Lampris incognitus]|uniref:uncharacterized protein si:ch211-153b23.7 n=1 Tax=Lampris incognitus TaxID=2546036 RepID=UPI0024B53956|nr:uncharacterized protein si:ch211-153b23.7 [Lampris incognitus]
MEGEPMSSLSLLSLSSSLSLAADHQTSPQVDDTLSQDAQEDQFTVESRVEDEGVVGERLLSGEEQVTLITESMSVTSSDQEKLLLLNKNTELRRVNKELMRLNEDWDQVYRSAMVGLQQRVESLEQENSAIRQLNNRLLLKVEHEQSAREFYEHTLMQELKKNQDLQKYIRTLENRMYNIKTTKDCEASLSAMTPESCPTSDAPGGPILGSSSGAIPPPCFSSLSFIPEAGLQSQSWGSSASSGTLGTGPQHQREVEDLKEQLEALRCQTQIYEAEYETEHKDHKHTLQENRKLRKKKEEMRQQVALLQEQLKVYEDDFRKERSDKQVLQRLLLKKTSTAKDPVLIHRCNNEQQPPGGDNKTQGGTRGQPQKQHHPLCPKHGNRDNEGHS